MSNQNAPPGGGARLCNDDVFARFARRVKHGVGKNGSGEIRLALPPSANAPGRGGSERRRRRLSPNSPPPAISAGFRRNHHYIPASRAGLETPARALINRPCWTTS